MFKTNAYDSLNDNPHYAHHIPVFNDGMSNNHSMTIKLLEPDINLNNVSSSKTHKIYYDDILDLLINDTIPTLYVVFNLQVISVNQTHIYV